MFSGTEVIRKDHGCRSGVPVCRTGIRGKGVGRPARHSFVERDDGNFGETPFEKSKKFLGSFPLRSGGTIERRGKTDDDMSNRFFLEKLSDAIYRFLRRDTLQGQGVGEGWIGKRQPHALSSRIDSEETRQSYSQRSGMGIFSRPNAAVSVRIFQRESSADSSARSSFKSSKVSRSSH